MVSNRFKAFAAISFSLLLISGGAAISFDTFIDKASCTASMIAPFLGGACTIATYDDISSGGPEDVQNDIYIKTSFVKDARERLNTEQRSQLNQTYGLAMSDAKLEVIKALNNDSTQSEASQDALKEVKELYSAYEQRVIAQRNREALKLNETIRKIEDTSGLGLGDVFKVRKATITPYQVEFKWVGPQDIRIKEKNYTLYNGTTVDLFEVQPKITWQKCDDTPNCQDKTDYLNFSTQATYTTRGKGQNDEGESFHVENPDTIIRAVNVDGENNKFIHGTPYVKTMGEINELYQSASTTVVNISDKVFNNYDQNEVDVSSVCGPLCSLKQASTSYEDTGAYSYLAHSLFQMGLASDAATAFEITWNMSDVTENPEMTETGQLFLETEAWEDTTIETGETYNASGKPAWFVYKPESGDAVKKSLTGKKFTVNELWNTRNSTQINETTVQKTDFYTESTDGLQSQLKNVTRVNDYTIEVDTPNTGGGGGAGLGNFFSSPAAIGGAVIAVLLLILGGVLLFVAGGVMT